jgi:hypothetical protein
VRTVLGTGSSYRTPTRRLLGTWDIATCDGDGLPAAGYAEIQTQQFQRVGGLDLMAYLGREPGKRVALEGIGTGHGVIGAEQDPVCSEAIDEILQVSVVEQDAVYIERSGEFLSRHRVTEVKLVES